MSLPSHQQQRKPPQPAAVSPPVTPSSKPSPAKPEAAQQTHPSASESGDKPFKCGICNIPFSSKAERKRHYYTEEHIKNRDETRPKRNNKRSHEDCENDEQDKDHEHSASRNDSPSKKQRTSPPSPENGTSSVDKDAPSPASTSIRGPTPSPIAPLTRPSHAPPPPLPQTQQRSTLQTAHPRPLPLTSTLAPASLNPSTTLLQPAHISSTPVPPNCVPPPPPIRDNHSPSPHHSSSKKTTTSVVSPSLNTPQNPPMNVPRVHDASNANVINTPSLLHALSTQPPPPLPPHAPSGSLSPTVNNNAPSKSPADNNLAPLTNNGPQSQHSALLSPHNTAAVVASQASQLPRDSALIANSMAPFSQQSSISTTTSAPIPESTPNNALLRTDLTQPRVTSMTSHNNPQPPAPDMSANQHVTHRTDNPPRTDPPQHDLRTEQKSTQQVSLPSAMVQPPQPVIEIMDEEESDKSPLSLWIDEFIALRHCSNPLKRLSNANTIANLCSALPDQLEPLVQVLVPLICGKQSMVFCYDILVKCLELAARYSVVDTIFILGLFLVYARTVHYDFMATLIPCIHAIFGDIPCCNVSQMHQPPPRVSQQITLRSKVHNQRVWRLYCSLNKDGDAKKTCTPTLSTTTTNNTTHSTSNTRQKGTSSTTTAIMQSQLASIDPATRPAITGLIPPIPMIAYFCHIVWEQNKDISVDNNILLRTWDLFGELNVRAGQDQRERCTEYEKYIVVKLSSHIAEYTEIK